MQRMRRKDKKRNLIEIRHKASSNMTIVTIADKESY